jgi:hypothetical protein
MFQIILTFLENEKASKQFLFVCDFQARETTSSVHPFYSLVQFNEGSCNNSY